MSWTVFHDQFEAVVRLNWAPRRRLHTHLLSCKDRLLTFYRVALQKQCMKMFRYVLKDHCGTTRWLQHTISARIPCCHQAVGPLGLRQATTALYPEGGSFACGERALSETFSQALRLVTAA
jgi:hypothetical protein